ncbi:MAG TPA: type II toxin-antitoxin system antitoxin SocA domain-containing protein [Micromonosporaceae bacterium]|nr:type II toxin-antitoxin system antitoxin SocA domain-containing protein [Micromonosporaceae bacterium]
MYASAHDVAAALRDRLPGLGAKKLHKLLYYCQGHHLASFGTPLFTEAIGAWDMGPVVERLWRDEKYGTPPRQHADLDEAALNTIGYVVSRYGALTGGDLEIMTHGEPPWQAAEAGRSSREQSPIRHEWMRDYFRAGGAPDDGVDGPLPEPALMSAWLREGAGGGATPAATPDGPEDSLDELRAWAARGA